MKPATWRDLGVALAIIVAVKAVLVLVDPQLRLFLGDSASYLYAACHADWLPPDRSFVYPGLIARAAPPGALLERLLYWQTAAGAVTAWLLAWVLGRRLALPRGVVLAAAGLFALAPAQLFYERMVMTEAFGLAAFAAFFAAASAYLARGRILWLPVTIALGLAAISLRTSYVPVVLVMSVLLPWLRLSDRRAPPRLLTVALHAALAIGCLAAVHTPYRAFVATSFDGDPGYVGASGFMRVGIVAPLLRPEDFRRVGLPGDFADHLAFELSDPTLRPAQLWMPGGLVDAIRARGLDVDTTCRKLAMYAFRRDPLGLVRLGFQTLGGYFDSARAAPRLAKDLGRDPSEYPDSVLALVRQCWRVDMVGVASRWTPVARWFAAGSGWLVFCLFLLAPLALANTLCHWRDPRRVQVVLGALFGLGLVAGEIVFSTIASYRYLQPFGFFVLANGLPLVVAVYRRAASASAR